MQLQVSLQLCGDDPARAEVHVLLPRQQAYAREPDPVHWVGSAITGALARIHRTWRRGIVAVAVGSQKAPCAMRACSNSSLMPSVLCTHLA